MSATVALALAAGDDAAAVCAHCGLPAAPGRLFCCSGCAAAHDIIEGLGLGRYYSQRLLAVGARALRPEPAERWDLVRHVVTLPDAVDADELLVDMRDRLPGV